MTAYVVSLQRDRAIVAGDSAMISIDGSATTWATKIMPIAHLRSLIFGRGVLRVAADCAAIVAELTGPAPQRARRPWKGPAPQYMRVKPATDRVARLAAGGLGGDPGRRQ
jgi:hypothetical protein